MHFLVPLLMLTLVVAAPGAVVYTTDFTNAPFFATGVVGGWSTGSTDNYIKGENYLGRFGAEDVALTLSGLPSNAGTITFDLYIIDSWDGDCAGSIGPDSVAFNFGSGIVGSHTYSRFDQCQQNYPVPASLPGAGRTGTYGVVGPFGSGGIDFYTWTLPYTAVGGVAAFTISGTPNQNLDDESWGIDNVTVNAVPEPSSVALLLGGAGFLLLRRRR